MVLCLYVSGTRGVAATYGYLLGGSVAEAQVKSPTALTFLFPGFSNRPPNRDARESTSPGKSRKPKTFNTSCCAPILIYSTLIQTPRKLQALNNKCSAIFLPNLALPYWSLAGFRPLLSQVYIYIYALEKQKGWSLCSRGRSGPFFVLFILVYRSAKGGLPTRVALKTLSTQKSIPVLIRCHHADPLSGICVA